MARGLWGGEDVRELAECVWGELENSVAGAGVKSDGRGVFLAVTTLAADGEVFPTSHRFALDML